MKRPLVWMSVVVFARLLEMGYHRRRRARRLRDDGGTEV